MSSMKHKIGATWLDGWQKKMTDFGSSFDEIISMLKHLEKSLRNHTTENPFLEKRFNFQTERYLVDRVKI